MARGARKVAPARPERQVSHPKLADRPRQLSAWSSAAAAVEDRHFERQLHFGIAAVHPGPTSPGDRLPKEATTRCSLSNLRGLKGGFQSTAVVPDALKSMS